MLERYLKLKEKYPKSVIMIKSGSFFECLCDDAIVLNNVLGYTIKKLNKYIRVGFPISSLNKVKVLLIKYEINYIIYANDGIIYSKFTRNNYSKYCNNNYFAVKNKIEVINNTLNERIFNSNINDIISEIEGILCRIN